MNAYEPKIIDSTIITDEWPKLHTAILQKQYDNALTIMMDSPEQVVLLTPRKFENEWERVACTSILCNKNSGFGFSALEIAIISDAPNDLIEYLLALGANANYQRATALRTKYGSKKYECELEIRTPLLAAVNKKSEILEYLDSPNISGPGCHEENLSSLYDELQKRMDVIQLLLDHGADPSHLKWKGTLTQSGSDGYSSYDRDGSWYGL